MPPLYCDDYSGWEINVLQLTYDDSDGLTQREIGESDSTLLIDYLNTSKKIASVSADYLSTAKDVEGNAQHMANMQRLVSFVDLRLEALDRGMMFTDDIQTVGGRISGRGDRRAHIAMIVLLGIIVVTFLLLNQQ